MIFLIKKKKAKKITDKKEREEARDIITKEVHKLAKEYDLSYNRIAIRNQRSRLGSCSSLKNLNFNWQITKFPYEKMMYIIKHELAHLENQNHSRNFWNSLKTMDPNYKENHKWIKENANKYLIF